MFSLSSASTFKFHHILSEKHEDKDMFISNRLDSDKAPSFSHNESVNLNLEVWTRLKNEVNVSKEIVFWCFRCNFISYASRPSYDIFN